MKNNKHLSLQERSKLSILHSQGKGVRSIAKILERSPSTISRELNRKEAVKFRENYVAAATHERVTKNWKNAHKGRRCILKQRNIRDFIEKYLQYGYSPAIICHLLKERFGETISTETLYQYIYSSSNDLKKYLLRRKKGRKSKKNNRFSYVGTGKNIPNRIDIDLRDELANKRKKFGHFEVDSIVSGVTKGKTKACLTVLVDRATRYTIIKKTASKTALQTTTSIIEALKPLSNNTISITYDNGCEFSQHEKINKILNTKSYFCKPYHSWEKGTVENINGLIRRFFPKGTDFDKITDEEIAYVEDWINNRPMKIFNYISPKQKLQHFGVAIAS